MTGVWISLGGALGAVARFAIGGWAAGWAGAGFPWATFLVNVSGSFLVGFVQRALPPVSASPRLRGFLTIGLCGGFTTFSAFDLETFALLHERRYVVAALYSTSSVVVCIAGVIAGLYVAAVAGRGMTGERTWSGWPP